jgi:hypothetical protein
MVQRTTAGRGLYCLYDVVKSSMVQQQVLYCSKASEVHTHSCYELLGASSESSQRNARRRPCHCHVLLCACSVFCVLTVTSHVVASD